MALNLENLGGRKFLLTLLAIGTATAIETLTDRGITEAYAMLMAGLVGVYGATNVAITRKALGATATEGAEPAKDLWLSSELTPAAMHEELVEIKTTIEGVAQNVLATSQLLAAAAQAQAPSAVNQAAANRAALNRQS